MCTAQTADGHLIGSPGYLPAASLAARLPCYEAASFGAAYRRLLAFEIGKIESQVSWMGRYCLVALPRSFTLRSAWSVLAALATTVSLLTAYGCSNRLDCEESGTCGPPVGCTADASCDASPADADATLRFDAADAPDRTVDSNGSPDGSLSDADAALDVSRDASADAPSSDGGVDTSVDSTRPDADVAPSDVADVSVDVSIDRLDAATDVALDLDSGQDRRDATDADAPLDTPSDGCALADTGPLVAPKLFTPAQAVYTGSFRAVSTNALKPTFVWTPVTGSCGVTYELEIDDSCTPGSYQACAFPSPEAGTGQTGTGFTSHTVPSNLAVETGNPTTTGLATGRRYYWHVRAHDGIGRVSPWSEVRYLEVGRVEGDWNGDGYSDLVVYDVVPHMRVYFGTPGDVTVLDGDRSLASGALSSSSLGGFGFVGDLNADGFAEFAHGDISDGRGKIAVYPGGANPGSDVRFFTGSTASSALGGAVLSGVQTGLGPAGDFNDDGFADLVASAPGEGLGTVYWFAGAASIDNLQPTALPYPGTGATPAFGNDARAVGDADGDGYADVAISASGSHELFLFFGGPGRSVTPQQVALPNAPAQIAQLGDMDGNGHADVGILYGNQIGVLSGGATTAWSFTPSTTIALSLSSGGFDFTGDTKSDLVIGFWNGSTATAPQYAAGQADLTTLTLQNMALPMNATPYLGFSMAMTRDFDGNGAAEVFAADPFAPNIAWYATPTAVKQRFVPTGLGSPGIIFGR
ncbi:MAG TPA: FG-GAP-like repeat-containing protein [Polyangiaceae bacterium]|nr:FG-GAP-like repeat-containing protein [Polyangiaceae bacterium]